MNGVPISTAGGDKMKWGGGVTWPPPAKLEQLTSPWQTSAQITAYLKLQDCDVLCISFAFFFQTSKKKTKKQQVPVFSVILQYLRPESNTPPPQTSIRHEQKQPAAEDTEECI